MQDLLKRLTPEDKIMAARWVALLQVSTAPPALLLPCDSSVLGFQTGFGFVIQIKSGFNDGVRSL